MRASCNTLVTILLGFALLTGCGDDDDAANAAGASGAGGGGASGSSGSSGSGGSPAPQIEAKTTEEQRIQPTHEVDPNAGPNPALPENLQSYIDDKYGEHETVAGEKHIARTFDGEAVPKAGANAKRLVRFIHLADLQIADDESPTRVGILDSKGATSAALRPQDAELCAMTNASVKTINVLHEKDPIDFVIMGGDNADSAQKNELGWVLGMLGGGTVECDSGDDDDIIEGPGNDGKDPFEAPGLTMPWKWVTGNHDILVQGNLPVEDHIDTVVGTNAGQGTRNYKNGGAVERGDFVVADPNRALMDRQTLMSLVKADGDGHGIGDPQVSAGKAYYAFDVEGTDLRFIVLDTGAEQGGSDGVIHQADIDAFVKPALDEAKTQGKMVILSSHHSIESLTTDGGTFGTEQPDAVTAEQWKDFLGGYGNVVFNLAGHSHEHRIRKEQPTTGNGWWEVMTSAIADYPNEFRIIEIYDEDNGYLRLHTTCVDFDSAGDDVAARGRMLGLIDYTTTWLPVDAAGGSTGVAEDRNVDLYIKKPQ